jgi:hypothetical protein
MQTKTIQSILDTVAPDLRTQIAKYLRQDLDIAQTRFQNLKDILRVGFDWSSTSEGFDSWHTVYLQS